jgi:hypothetical protein
MALPRVFVSMGTPYTPQSAQFRDELERVLRDVCRVDPRIIGKNEYPSGSPLAHIRTTMRSCAGVIIVAYERKFVEAGVEKRGAPAAQALANRIYTTPWNHIESAMAYSLELPLYIFCQNGLSEEGLIESKVDWYVQHLDIAPSALANTGVQESLRAWIDTRVIPRAQKKSHVIESLRGQIKFSEMTPHELWSLIGMLAVAFGAGAFASPYLRPLAELMHLIHNVQ